jgi:hypothetical protein
MGAGLEKPVLTHWLFLNHLAKGTIVNPQVIPDLLKSVTIFHVSFVNTPIPAGFGVIYLEELFETWPADVTLFTRDFPEPAVCPQSSL